MQVKRICLATNPFGMLNADEKILLKVASEERKLYTCECEAKYKYIKSTSDTSNKHQCSYLDHAVLSCISHYDVDEDDDDDYVVGGGGDDEDDDYVVGGGGGDDDDDHVVGGGGDDDVDDHVVGGGGDDDDDDDVVGGVGQRCLALLMRWRHKNMGFAHTPRGLF